MIGFVRVEDIEHNPDADRIRVLLIDECLHLLNELLLAPALRHLDVSSASKRCTQHEETPRAVAFVGVVVQSDRSRT